MDVGDSTYDTLDRHDHLLAVGVVPAAPYYPRNINHPLDIEYRIEGSIEEHIEGSEYIQLKLYTLDEAHNCRTGVEQTNDAVKTAASNTSAPKQEQEIFLSLCLRIVIAITNFDRGR